MISGVVPARTGWTGSLTATIDAVVAEYEPADGDSVATAVARLVEACVEVHGGEWGVYVDGDGAVSLTGPAHTLGSTGTTTTYLADPGIYPVGGVEWSSSPALRPRGRVTADGSVAVPAAFRAGTWTVGLIVELADAPAVEQAMTGAWDVWAGGRVMGRLQVARVVREPVGGDERDGRVRVEVSGPGGLSPALVRRRCMAEGEPAARLTAWIDRSVPGVRLCSGDGGGADPVGTTDYVPVEDGLVIHVPGVATWSTSGHTGVVEGVEMGEIEWGDWLGWVLGATTLPSTTGPSLIPLTCPYVSPASIPLWSAQWDAVQIDADRAAEVDRWAVARGSSWGGHQVWRVGVETHVWGLDAIAEGWVLRGRVRVDWIAEPLDGQIVGVESVRWLGDDLATVAVVLLIATPLEVVE